jgi:hypothetical protein
MTFIQFLKRVCLFPQTIAHAITHRREQIVLDANEVERLDRIRNPSKYLGK